jgi:hypothetical protein
MEAVESAVKLIGTLALIAFVFTGVLYATQWNVRYGLAESVALPAAALPAVLPSASPAESLVILTGTLIYADQQGKTVPYIQYEGPHGTATKALAFRGESVCVTSVEGPCPGSLQDLIADYGSGPVSVTGIVDDESLIVERVEAAR